MDFGIITYGAIAAICYAIGYVLKSLEKFQDEYIPAIVIVSGVIFGVVAFLIKVPDFPATDIINAIAVGVVSAGAAIAANQIKKQKDKIEEVVG